MTKEKIGFLAVVIAVIIEVMGDIEVSVYEGF